MKEIQSLSNYRFEVSVFAFFYLSIPTTEHQGLYEVAWFQWRSYPFLFIFI